MGTVNPFARNEFNPAFVVPRYGTEVVGGAEELARRTAEELAARGHPVTVLTTCAQSHYTWENTYPQGVTDINGVRVIRFRARTRLGNPKLSKVIHKISTGQKTGKREEESWLEGVVSSPDLIDYLQREGGRFSHLIFLPYLFGTTYFGSAVHPEKSYIIPCLHDEPYARIRTIRKMLSSVAGLIFNSESEMLLARRILGNSVRGSVVGLGFREKKARPEAFFNRHPVRGDFLLYAGRREQGKNTPLLVSYFRRFARENRRPLSLVLIGIGDVEIPHDSREFIFDLGIVPERAKNDCYAASFAFCQPSVNESFSIVLMESWLFGKPALVNFRCPATREHVDKSGGGLAFSNYDEFREGLLFLLENRETSRALGESGRQYVRETYSWDNVIVRFFAALGVG